ncbi:hypothetical protein LIS04_64 [Listeria phage LIS04]|nr:hypothetical protein LIS04_64 [Listeria phage LIS04]
MSKELSIVDKLISKKKNEGGLNESLTLELFEASDSCVGKTFEVASDIQIGDDKSLESGKVLFVKDESNGKLEIEVRSADGEMIGMMSATKDAFDQLLKDKKLTAAKTDESVQLDEASKEAEGVIPDLAKAIIDEDFEAAEKLFEKLPEGEEVYEDLVASVASAGSLSEEDATDLVDEFSDYLNLEVEDEDGEEQLEERMKKVVRGGQVVKIKVPIRKKRLSAKRRMALVKARRKAHTSKANRNRRKSMIIRKRRIKESFDMLKSAEQVFVEGGITVLDREFDTTNEGLELKLVLDNSTNEKYEVDLDAMEAHFTESFGSPVTIDMELLDESKSAVVKFTVQ